MPKNRTHLPRSKIQHRFSFRCIDIRSLRFSNKDGCKISTISNQRFFRGRDDISTEDRVRILRLIENMTLGRNAVGYLTESLHGAGSPQAQRIQILRNMDVDAKKRHARKLAGIIATDTDAV